MSLGAQSLSCASSEPTTQEDSHAVVPVIVLGSVVIPVSWVIAAGAVALTAQISIWCSTNGQEACAQMADNAVRNAQADKERIEWLVNEYLPKVAESAGVTQAVAYSWLVTQWAGLSLAQWFQGTGDVEIVASEYLSDRLSLSDLRQLVLQSMVDTVQQTLGQSVTAEQIFSTNSDYTVPEFEALGSPYAFDQAVKRIFASYSLATQSDHQQLLTAFAATLATAVVYASYTGTTANCTTSGEGWQCQCKVPQGFCYTWIAGRNNGHAPTGRSCSCPRSQIR